MTAEVRISVVIPIYNEVESLPVLHGELAAVMAAMAVSWEVLYVDDCSTDGSLRVMLELRREDPHVRIIKFRRNTGQTPAMAAGFDHSRGRIVITMDGDLQNDPADIPFLVDEIERGYDIVAGWRKERRDAMVLRRIPSIAANRLIAFVTGVFIHDTGCTLKAFRSELVKNLPIYAEQHRFIPAMSAGSGARVTEIVVNHRPRRFGHSKYGINRAVRVFLDLMSVKLISQFSQKPLQYFGLLASVFLLFGMVFAAMGLASLVGDDANEPAWMLQNWQNVTSYTLMLVASLIVYFALMGLLAELAVKASGMHRRGILDRILNELH